MSNGIGQTFLASCRTGRPHPHSTDIQIHVVDHDHHVIVLDPVKVNALSNASAARIHVGLRSQQNDLLAINRMVGDQSVKPRPGGRKEVSIRKSIQYIEPHIVSGSVVSRTRISKSCDQFHRSARYGVSSLFFAVTLFIVTSDDFRLDTIAGIFLGLHLRERHVIRELVDLTDHSATTPV